MDASSSMWGMQGFVAVGLIVAFATVSSSVRASESAPNSPTQPSQVRPSTEPTDPPPPEVPPTPASPSPSR